MPRPTRSCFFLFAKNKLSSNFSSIDKIIVATTNSPSDDDIQAWCDANDIICFRGDEENVLKRFYDCAIANCLDIIVRITGDDPFKDFRLIDRAVDCIIASNLDFVCNNSPVTYPEGLDVEVITFNALKKIYQNALTSDHREHVTLYVHENISAFNTLNLSNGKDMSYHRWTIDYAEDYHFARVVYEELYTDGELVEAESLFTEVAYHGDARGMSPSDLAAVQLNRGLCLMALSRAESEASAELGLSYAQQAQLAFLAAKRYVPEMDRSGMRLESTSTWVAELQVRIAEEAEEQDAMQAQMEQRVEVLEALFKAQQQLRQKVADSDVNRRHPKRAKNAPPPPPIQAPEDAGVNAPIFVTAEKALKAEAERIYTSMQKLDTQLAPPALEGIPTMESLMAEPLKLMAKVPPAMEGASGLLSSWNTWPSARAEQLVAEHLIEEILSLLWNNSSDESDGEDWDEMEDYEDYEYSDDMDESMMSSMPMEGDFAAGGEMQSLPVPNYSAEDILMEEQGSMQFRQQQRAKANAGKVEKDY